MKMDKFTLSFDISNCVHIYDLYKQNKLNLSIEDKNTLLKTTFNYLTDKYRSDIDRYKSIYNKELYDSYNKIKCIFEDMHGCYSKYNLQNVKDMLFIIQSNKTKTIDNVKNGITVTMTTCKRFDLFERTVNSFLECCIDKELITEWIVIDDNSSEKDKEKMKELYPFINFIFKKKEEKGHVQSMNMLYNLVKTPYMFNMEDDWEFFYKDNYLTRCLKVLSLNDKYGQCLVNKSYGEGNESFESIGGILHSFTNSYGENYYFEHHFINNENDTREEIMKYSNVLDKTSFTNQYYWPHFSFRVGLTKMSIFKEIGKFNHVNHFEMEYAYRYANKGYTTVFLDSIYCSHIGRRTNERFDKNKSNAYELNQVNQFGEKITESPKEVVSLSQVNSSIKVEKDLNKMFKTVMVNLKRRPDRLRTFFDNNKHILPVLNIEIEEAVDGEAIQLNQKMRRIFQTSDTQFRKGIMGCAFSHIKLWGKIANDPDYNMYLVLEDDIILRKDTEDILKVIPETMEKTYPDWDILFLGHHSKVNIKGMNERSLLIEKYTPEQFMEKSYGGTFCYIINKNGAMKLLSSILTNGMNYAIDWDMTRLDCMNNYYMYPLLASSEMANDIPGIDSDIQKSKSRYQNNVCDWIMDDIKQMIIDTNSKGIMYFERDNWNEFIYNSFEFDTKTKIIVSNTLVNKNLLFTYICFTQITDRNINEIQELAGNILEKNLPIYFYTMYERYIVTVPESLYYKFEEIKKHFSFTNKLDTVYVV
jgi:GR25 family glycosyltransferase involved in LPS biosynthesis